MLCVKCGSNDLSNAKNCVECGAELLVNLETEKLRKILYKCGLFYKKEKYDTGIKFCSFKLSDYPNCAPLYSNLAAFYFLEKDFDRAKISCQRALNINPDLTPAQEILKIISKEEKKHFKFFKDIKSILRLSLILLIFFATIITIGTAPNLLRLSLCFLFISVSVILYNTTKHNYIPENILGRLKIEDYRNISKVRRFLSGNLK